MNLPCRRRRFAKMRRIETRARIIKASSAAAAIPIRQPTAACSTQDLAADELVRHDEALRLHPIAADAADREPGRQPAGLRPVIADGGDARPHQRRELGIAERDQRELVGDGEVELPGGIQHPGQHAAGDDQRGGPVAHREHRIGGVERVLAGIAAHMHQFVLDALADIGERIGVALEAMPTGHVVGRHRHQRDAAMAERQQIARGAVGAGDLVGAHRIELGADLALQQHHRDG